MKSSNKIKKIAIASDHRGYGMKEAIVGFLKRKNYKVVDCGTHSERAVDYPDFVMDAAEKVGNGVCDRAIGLCYTGIGSSIAANKVPGVRAALVHSVKEAQLSRAHNDANMLILGAGFLPKEILNNVIQTWLTTPFAGGRHERRLDKIQEYEQRHA